MFNNLLHVLEDASYLQTVYHTMVKGQIAAKHIPRYEGAINIDGLFGGAAKTHNRYFGKIDDGRGHIDGEHPHIGYGEGSAGLLAIPQFFLLCSSP